MIAEVLLWGSRIGAVNLDAGRSFATFQYDPGFVRSGIEVAPLMMPLGERTYQFPDLRVESFHRLPGMLADSLPDKFGNALIDAWLATQGRAANSFSAVERLCYIGSRGMGALEFAPARGPRLQTSRPIEVSALVSLAGEILQRRSQLQGYFDDRHKENALRDILSIGTSAGGARAKAIISWNQKTNEVRSGQVDAGRGFDYWLLKFDGVKANKDKELDDPQGYGIIEYAYFLMATAAGISMSECRLLEENGRHHFMTKRFDRTRDGDKLHMQSLGALAHFDFNLAGAYSYEQALRVIRDLRLPMESVEQQYRRMAFNIVARNQDDHVKNIAFLMNKGGGWALSPAYDVNYSYEPTGLWTSSHQMSMNGKRDDFILADFAACAKVAGMKRGRGMAILDEVVSVVKRWEEFANRAGCEDRRAADIARQHRLEFRR